MRGHHSHLDVSRVPLSHCRRGLVQPACVEPASVQHARLSYAWPPWKKRCCHMVLQNIQYRPGLSFYGHGSHANTEGRWRVHLHGWQGALDGERFHRAPVALGEMGGIHLRKLESGSQTRQARGNWFPFYYEQRHRIRFLTVVGPWMYTKKATRPRRRHV